MKAKELFKKTVSIVLCAVMLFIAAAPASLQVCDLNIGITAEAASTNPGERIVAQARKYAGMTQSQMGYNSAWCAWFVCRCAKEVGQSAAVPNYGNCDDLYRAVINAGGTCVSKPEAGCLIFYKCSACGRFPHVAICNGTGGVIHGNYYYDPKGKLNNISHVQEMTTIVYHHTKNGKSHTTESGVIKPVYVRPAYKTSSDSDKDSSSSGGNSTVTIEDNQEYLFIPRCAPKTTIGPSSNKNFGNVQLVDQSNKNAVWTAHKYGKYWYFTNSAGYILDVYGDSPKSKSNVQVYRPSNGKPNNTELFEIKTSGKYIYLVLKGTNIAVDCYGDSGHKKGTNVWTWTYSSKNNTQAFTLKAV